MCAVNEGIVAGPVGIIGLNTLEYPDRGDKRAAATKLVIRNWPDERGDHFRFGCCNSIRPID